MKKIERKIIKVKAVSKPAKAAKQEKAEKPKKAVKIVAKVEEKIEKPQPQPKADLPMAEKADPRQTDGLVPLAEKIVRKKATKLSAPQKDTGSVDFQINNFSKKIASLAKHLKAHPHDFDSRRGLLIMVGKRRRLLNYVKKNEPEKYESLAKSLKLKK